MKKRGFYFIAVGLGFILFGFMGKVEEKNEQDQSVSTPIKVDTAYVRDTVVVRDTIIKTIEKPIQGKQPKTPPIQKHKIPTPTLPLKTKNEFGYIENLGKAGVKVHFTDNSPKAQFLFDIIPLALQEADKYDIPASVTIAQAILETGWGQSEFLKRDQNHFGIKAKDEDLTDEERKLIKGSAVRWTKEQRGRKIQNEQAKFYTYSSRWASFRHRSVFLEKRMESYDKYAKLKEIPRCEWKLYAKYLAKAGYATDEHYFSKLVKIIETYGLYVLDGNCN